MKRCKLEGIELIRVLIDFDFSVCNWQGWHCLGTAYYRKGLRRKKVDFCYFADSEQKVIYNEEEWNFKGIPKKNSERKALLVLINGEIARLKGRLEMIQYFKKLKENEIK